MQSGETAPVAGPTEHFNRIARLLLAIGENRLHLWVLEVQQERANLFDLALSLVAAIVTTLLCTIAVSGMIVVLLWGLSPVLAFGILAGVYGVLAFFFFHRLSSAQRDWKPLQATLEQLQKDRLCLEKLLS